jgi:di/tricarboxylate transporter
MTFDQALVLAILAGALALFLWGRWRHDMVALAALLAGVVGGVVPADAAFSGFGHPAVITVACVLVLSRGLQNSGAIDLLAQRVLPTNAPPLTMLAGLTGLTALLSGFMNNVGALALMMPIAIQTATRIGWAPGRILMPLAFGSILGGMTTLIGTPPNLIVSAFRDEEMGGPFRMFDFTPVGLAVAATGVAFVTLVGWRLVPERKRAGVEGFDTAAYLTEARVPATARAVGMTLREVEERLEEAHAQVLGLVRNEVRLRTPSLATPVREGDILVIEAEPEGVASALAALGMKLVGDVAPTEEADEHADKADAGGEPVAPAQRRAGSSRGGVPGDEENDEDDEDDENTPQSPPPGEDGDIVLSELVVPPNSTLIRRNPTEISLRRRHHVNLLALSRQGRRAIGRLKQVSFQPGDVLLIQGSADDIRAFGNEYGLLPLAERAIRLPDRRRVGLVIGIFLAAVAIAAAGLLPAAVAFAGGVLAVMVTRVVPPRTIYTAVDWPVIVLLGALLPVAEAMRTTGAAGLLAGLLVDNVAVAGGAVVLAVLLVLTMTLSDLMNNNATVAVMAPIGLGAAAALGANPDAFLMAIAIGGSCAFLTPIGHQNNTLILGPGGFRFGDYWRLGLPLEALVVAVTVPMILLVWGL